MKMMPINKLSESQSDGEDKSSEKVSPLVLSNQSDADPNHKESRTTHLEKRLNQIRLDMQV